MVADAETKPMIHYQIRCSRGHEFDGWFKDSQGFDSQAGQGLVECPVCRDTNVTRALMAPALPRAVAAPAAEPQAPAAPPEDAQTTAPPPAAASKPMAITGSGLPDQMRAFFQRVRAEVEKNCDYVGPSFADEARRMHQGEGKRRGIYGEATPEQAESLSDEGISVTRIPWVDRAEG